MKRLPLILAMAVVLFGCEKPVISTNAAGPTDKPSASDSRKPVPEFQVAKLDGGSITASDLRGKVVLLDFWATWCDPCKDEIPDYNALQEKYAGKDVQILGVTME